MEKDSDVHELTDKLRNTTLNNTGPRRSERKKRLRLLENTIPWNAYQELHYSQLLGQKCWNTNRCRRKTCKTKQQIDDNKKTERRENEKQVIKNKAKKCLRKATRSKRIKPKRKITLRLKMNMNLQPASSNIIRCLRFLINKSLRAKITTQSGQLGKQKQICVDIPLSITMFHTLFLHKMKLPVRNIRKFDISVRELKKLLGPDWVYCCTANTGTQVRICGLITIHHRKKHAKKFSRSKCRRCWKSKQHDHDHQQVFKSGGHWLRMRLQYIRENTDSCNTK